MNVLEKSENKYLSTESLYDLTKIFLRMFNLKLGKIIFINCWESLLQRRFSQHMPTYLLQCSKKSFLKVTGTNPDYTCDVLDIYCIRRNGLEKFTEFYKYLNISPKIKFNMDYFHEKIVFSDVMATRKGKLRTSLFLMRERDTHKFLHTKSYQKYIYGNSTLSMPQLIHIKNWFYERGYKKDIIHHQIQKGIQTIERKNLLENRFKQQSEDITFMLIYHPTLNCHQIIN